MSLNDVRKGMKKFSSFDQMMENFQNNLCSQLNRTQDSAKREAMTSSLGFHRLFADSIQPSQYPATNFVPYQYLTNLDPSYVANIMVALAAEEAMGSRIYGDWADESIIFQTREHQSDPQLYSIGNNIQTSDLNLRLVERSIVRIQMALDAPMLDVERTSKMNVDLISELRTAAMRGISLKLDQISFNGFNDGINKTYGMLNDPDLFPFFTLPTGDWASTGTYDTITADIRAMVAELMNRSLGNIDPKKVPCTLAVALNSYTGLDVTSIYGNSVMDFIRKTYPMMEVMSVPRFNSAVSSLNAVYLYANSFNDGYSPNGEVFSNVYQSKFRVMGTFIDYNGTVKESYMAASCGATVRRPQAVVNAAGC